MPQSKDILTGENNEILRQVSKEIDPKLAKKAIAKMRKIIDKQPALGLAAPQIGKNVRVILVSLNKEFLAMINPKITNISLETEICEEGCLSVPGFWGDVERAKDITVEFISETGISKKLKLSKLSARIVQHEVDHLDGVLFTDKLIAKNVVENKKKEELNF